MAARENVEFQTMDELTMRGWFYAAEEKGPGIIMTPGLNLPKNELYANVARSFQRAGFPALVYDPRGVGRSDGMPRDINPAKQTTDFHDAVTYMKSRPSVDPNRIIIWGYSLSASAGLIASALDRRVKLVIAICPAIPLDLEDKEKCDRFLAQAIWDRESQVRGNGVFCIPYLGESGEEALYDFRKFRGVGHEDLDKIEEYVPHFSNSITMQSFYHLITWNFMDLLKSRPPRVPVFQVCAAEEELPHVKRNYITIFDSLLGPKEMHVEPDKGHIDILKDDDDRFVALMETQIDFTKKHLGD